MLMPVIDWKELWGKRGLRIGLAGVSAVLCLCGIGVAGYYFWPEPAPTPPPPLEDSTVSENVDYMATDDFSRLSLNKRVAWFEERMRRDEGHDDELAEAWVSMDEATRRRIGENMRPVMRERLRRHTNQFTKLRGEEREVFLDERVDEMRRWERQMRAMMGSHRDRSSASGRRYADLTEEQIKTLRERRQKRVAYEVNKFLTEGSADSRAKQMSYFSAIGKRRMRGGLMRALRGGNRRRQ